MERMRIELEDAGHLAEFAATNVPGQEGLQSNLTNLCSFPLFQDQADLDARGHMGAAIRELLLYDRDGKLAFALPWHSPDGGPGVFADLSVPANYAGVKSAIESLE
jgi:hypothetical protein